MNLRALTRRLDKIEAQQLEHRNASEQQLLYTLAMIGVPVRTDAPFTRGQRTVLSWPRRLSLEEWEAQAMPYLEKSFSEARDDCRTTAATTRDADPADVTHRYKPSVGPHVEPKRVLTPEQRAASALLTLRRW